MHSFPSGDSTLTQTAAKLSQVGFTETLAKEGYKYNIICNVIAPIGKTHLLNAHAFLVRIMKQSGLV